MLVEIFCVVFSDNGLKFFLPTGNIPVKRFCCRSKVIGCIVTLFVKINVHFGLPLVKKRYPCSGLFLGLPGPIAVQIKIIMIGPAAWPVFPVFTCNRVGIGYRARCRAIKINVTLATVRIQTGVYHNQGIF